MAFESRHTRFRAYQLTSLGSSFSYWDAATKNFTLGEARLNDDNVRSVAHELGRCGKNQIDELYISSWDKDHCTASELELILNKLKPKTILYPGYEPDSEKENQTRSKRLIDEYLGPPNPTKYQGRYTGNQAQSWGYSKFTHSQDLSKYQKSNDKSVIHMWRTGNISVLSVGDLESPELASKLAVNTLMKEVDVLILSHHGSSPDFTTKEYLEALSPKVCLALVDRKNQFGHPNPNVYRRVNEASWYFSTKDGDVIIETYGENHDCFQVFNYVSNGEKLDKIKSFKCKKKDKFEEELANRF
ncbi:ComEC/Rec2 family competence protein [Ekhidna sp. To15]|uniref:ComEC/Rec2 family competence protein n=1 Tax=Ekhidna sp. To15 TaxID=3395267 RepID=UPI003F51C9D3